MCDSLTRQTLTALALVAALALAAPALAEPAAQQEGTAPAEQQQAGTALDIPVVLITDDDVETAAGAVVVQGGGRNWYFGVRGGAYFDVDEPFIGVELLFPLTSDIWFNPNVEWVFVDNADLATVNLDVHFDLPAGASYSFWIGGGLGLRYFNPDGPRDGDWDPGANILAGLGFGHGRVIPYVQAKVFVSDGNSEFILAGGFRF